MPIYDRPVRLLMHDMVRELLSNPGDELTREEAIAWFRSRYPNVKEATVGAQLIKGTTNAPSRIHYGPRPGGEDDLLFQIERGRYRRYVPGTDPAPIQEKPVAGEADLRALLLPIVESVYPAWAGFDDPRFVNDEITYKQRGVAAAAEMLKRSELELLVARGEYDEIFARLKAVARRGGNLLWLNMPEQGDLRILHTPGLDRAGFCAALFDLLYDEGESHERLARYLEYVRSAGLPSTWAFPTYFLFVCNPESELLLKPTWTRRFLELVGRRGIFSDTPDAGSYEAMLRLAGELRAAFDEFDPADMVDLQSLMWVCARGADEATSVSMDIDPKRIEVRMAAEGRASVLLAARLGKLDETSLREFLREVNTDWENGRMHYNRFGTTFGGSLVVKMLGDLDALNRWTAWIWNADDASLDRLLDEFWQTNPVKGAGRGYATMLLYLKEPQRHAIWLPALDRGLAALTDYKPTQARTAAEYRRYQTAVRALRVDYALAPQGVDLVLSRASMGNMRPLPVIGPAPSAKAAYPLAEIAGRTSFPLEKLERWVRAIERKKQAIIYGPPGTGKTFIAQELARHLAGSAGLVETVQFHPAYAYEDFMQGIRPQLTPKGELDYRMMRGRFLAFCDEAREREGNCVMIIDEINRANLARVFGELMYLLEYREQSVPLAGGGEFAIPANVRIIGTMNTADRSIALVDHALRRRFAFLELGPEYEVLVRFHQDKGTGFPAARLVDELRRLNSEINDPHYAVGISYFLDEQLKDNIEDIWRMEIEPYLAEYFYDQPAKVKVFLWEEVGGRLNV